jgi:hypothetical protein
MSEQDEDPYITLDLETYFDARYSLRNKDLTMDGYIKDERFEMLVLGYAFGEEPVTSIRGQAAIADWITNQDWSRLTVIGQNVAFDLGVLSFHFGISPAHIVDTMAMSRAVFGPGKKASLSAIAERLDLPKKTINYASFKGKRFAELSPVALDHLAAGCERDVELTRTIAHRLAEGFPPNELLMIDLTVRMFTEPVITGDAEALASLAGGERDRKASTLKSLGVEKGDLTSAAKFVAQLEECGVEVEHKAGKRGDIAAIAKTDAFMQDLCSRGDRAGQLAKARLDVQSSLTERRAQRLAEMAARGAMPIQLNYFGAATGRWSGAGQVNWQNLPNARQDKELKLRGKIMAPPGHLLVVIDFSMIEYRLNCGLAEELGQLEVLSDRRIGLDGKLIRDVYREFGDAHLCSNVPIPNDPKELKNRRNFSKKVVLGCGYGMGFVKFAETCQKDGQPIELYEAKAAVNAFRRGHPSIVRFWNGKCTHALRIFANGDPNTYQLGPVQLRENEVPPWEDQDGAHEDGHLGETEGKDKPDGAVPQGNSPWGAELEEPLPLPNGAYRDFGECQAANDYLDRIGARWSSMDTAIVETAPDQDGYRASRVSIKFGSNGFIIITPTGEAEKFAPTGEESAAIREEAQYCSLIKPVEIIPGELLAAPRTPQKVKKAIEENRLFALHDARTGRCTVLQERVEANASHKKSCIPWTFWSDGRWLERAPSGPFPFWGVDALRAAPEEVAVFLHEGAKCARFAANLPTDHPWADELKTNAVHLGWISGARAPENNDWTGLAKVLEAKKVKYVVIVCDNDHDGRKALLPIAREIHAATFALRFPGEWAKGFDIADPFPASCWKPDLKGRLHCDKPSFLDCLTACTWPLDYIYGSPPPPAKGKKTKVVVCAEDRSGTEAGEMSREARIPLGHKPRPAFVEQWGFVDATGQFINRLIPAIALSKIQFDNAMRPFSRECGPLSNLILPELELHCGSMAYRPGRPEIIGEDGQRLFNCYRPGNVKRAIGGDIAPFLEFMEYLIPITRDRDESLRWMATLIAHPERRLLYGILGISTKQGIGKDTWATIIRMCVGYRNCSNPSASHIITSAFHEWRVNKLLCIVSEIYEGDNWSAYNKIKTLVTEKHQESNLKFIGSHTLDCWVHFMLFSNSLRCLKIENDDRRWLVPKIAEMPWPPEKFQEFYDWLFVQGGFGIVLDWALDFDAKHGGQYVLDGARAVSERVESNWDSRIG